MTGDEDQVATAGFFHRLVEDTDGQLLTKEDNVRLQYSATLAVGDLAVTYELFYPRSTGTCL